MTSGAAAGSLRRGVLILKLLASAGRRGMSLTELALKAGMPHPSAHRVLRQLVDERLVEYHDQLRRYRLGPLAFELGVAGSTLFDPRDLCSSAMDTLAHSTGDTVYLCVRSGFETVCLDRREGRFPIRALILEVGSRWPLGVGAAGLAMLAAVPSAERDEIIERVEPRLRAFGKLTARELSRMCDEAEDAGAALIQSRINHGVNAVGVALRDGMGHPVVAALGHRMGLGRMRTIKVELLAAGADVEQGLRRQFRSDWSAGLLLDPATGR